MLILLHSHKNVLQNIELHLEFILSILTKNQLTYKSFHVSSNFTLVQFRHDVK